MVEIKHKSPVVLVLLIFAVIHFTETLPTRSGPSNDCFPRNWKYAWSRVGNTWYTLHPKQGTWIKAESACSSIEPGRSMLASASSINEMNHISGLLKTYGVSDVWSAGVAIGEAVRVGPWFWYRNFGKVVRLERITGKTFWRKGEPNEPVDHSNANLFASDGTWHDYPTGEHYRGLCEIRC